MSISRIWIYTSSLCLLFAFGVMWVFEAEDGFLSFEKLSLLSAIFWAILLLSTTVIYICYKSAKIFLVSAYEQVAKEAEHRQSLSQQTAKMSALGEMVGGIAHEINTPLGAIKLFIGSASEEVSEKNPNLEAIKESLYKADATIDRIAKIIKGLRTFSRSGERDPFQTYSVQEIVEDALILCGDRFRSENVDLRWNIPAETIYIECRPVEITQVILNLVSNSFDAIRNFKEKWIEIDLDGTADKIVLRITDCGKGIAEEKVEKIFQPFYTTKEVGKGTGIGLSISLGIIKSHHGALFVDHKNPHTTFILEIPKKQAKAA